MKTSNQDCVRILELDLKKAHGHQMSRKEKLLYETHMAACPDCLAELRVLEALSEQNASGALPELDEFSRWRLVDDILAQADATPPQQLEEVADDGSVPTKLSSYRLFALAGTLAAAAIAAVLFWQSPREKGSETIAITENTSPSVSPLTGHFALLSGEVLLGAQNAVIGDQLGSGDRVETGEGRAVVDLPSEIVLSLGPETSLQIHTRDDLGYDVVLDRGQIRVSLPPKANREELSIVTPKGTVEVTGTVFSVNADDDSVEVRVLRGQVAISDRGGRQRRLGSRTGTSLGSTRVWSLTQIEEESLWEEVRVLELLDSSDNAVVAVQSTPLGADVEIDSVYIGKTPVKAAIRAGYREIHVALNGEQSARKLLDLHKGAHMSWDVDFDAESQRIREPDASSAEAERPVAEIQKSRILQKKIEDPESSLSAAELLMQAQQMRAARDWTGAAGTYQRLIQTYPDADESRAAFVSLGEIQLSKLERPMSALQHFNNYLAVAQRGPLAREALYGKIRALRALGRYGEESQAIAEFLERFPTAVRTREIRTRQKELEAQK